MYKQVLRSKLLYVFTLMLVAGILSSCITARKINYLQKPSGAIPAYKGDIGYEEYNISGADKLYIRVYSPDKDINTIFNGSSSQMMMGGTMQSGSDYTDLYTYQVKNNGAINLPLVGDVFLAGQTIREAKKTVENAIKTTMKDDCSVDVRIVGRYFSVIGSRINGKYPIMREKMNIFQAMAMAGDIGTFGDRSKIKVLRETPNGPQIKVFDIRSKDIINSEFYYIQPNDVIYIQDVKSQFFSVTSFGSALSTLFSTFSFGMLIYYLAVPEKPAPVTTSN